HAVAGVAPAADKPGDPAHASHGESTPSRASELIACSVALKRPFDAASFTADSRRLVVGAEDVMALYDLRDLHAEAKPLANVKYVYPVLLGEKPPLRIALAPDGGRVWLATVDRAIVKGQVRPPGPVLGWYEPDNPEPQRIFPCDGATFTCLAASPTDPH